MRILCDTREQVCLTFELDNFLTGIDRVKLDAGDYQALYADGTKSKTVFERKGSLSDLFGTLGRSYKRFRKELDRARTSGVRLVLIIQATYSEVLEGFERSQLEGISIVRKLMTLEHRYGLRTVYCSSAKEMSHYIKHYFIAEANERLRDANKPSDS